MSKSSDVQNLAQEKKRLRKEILSIRNAMPPQLRCEKSNIILQTVYSMDIYQKADMVLTYADYQSEVITSPLIERALMDGKLVFCPKTADGNDMEFYRIRSLKELEEGYKGIREPVSGEPFASSISELNILDKRLIPLIIVPGVVFDRDCGRIGYGKGFYDKYMTRMSEKGIKTHCIGLGYECQMVLRVPCEIHDIKLDMIVTEKEIYVGGGSYCYV